MSDRAGKTGTGSKTQNAREKIKIALRAVWGAIVSLFILLLMLLLWGANITSCITGSSDTDKDARKLELVKVDEKNARHVKLKDALETVWFEATLARNAPKICIAESRDINAASFGAGRFVIWDGVADLPEKTIRAVLAHEVAHDIMRHSKKAQDVKDLTDFFGDVLSFFGGANASTEKTLKRWVGYTAVPKYSRKQEFEADAKAITILTMLGSSEPNKELADTLEILLAKYGNTGGGFFDSHPSTADRIQRLRTEPASATKK